jgi:hypothetical protein
MTKIAGSGSISQRHGFADPDPDPPQNVMDPQHCCRHVQTSTDSCFPDTARCRSSPCGVDCRHVQNSTCSCFPDMARCIHVSLLSLLFPIIYVAQWRGRPRGRRGSPRARGQTKMRLGSQEHGGWGWDLCGALYVSLLISEYLCFKINLYIYEVLYVLFLASADVRKSI